MREFSAGGVVCKFEEGSKQPLVLMILDRFGCWTLPKGLVERGEAPTDAALREVEEETGIRGEVIDELGKVSYFYSERTKGRIFKEVVYYLIKATGGKIRPQLTEIDDAKWFAMEEAAAICCYENNREIILKAADKLRDIFGASNFLSGGPESNQEAASNLLSGGAESKAKSGNNSSCNAAGVPRL